MRLSVIIPTLQERQTLARAIRSAFDGGVDEVIVADGGSDDGTVAEAKRAGARVVCGPPGRGLQQNLGARAATGDTLLFLHADTVLPPDCRARVAETLALPGVSAGAFRFRLDAEGWGLRLVEWMVDLRCRWRQLPYGDQGLFLRREMFEAVGGFPDDPVMEDYVLVRKLRRLGRIHTCKAAAVTSARRWLELGVWRTTWINQVCLWAYRLNVSPSRIARWRSTR